MRIWCSSKKNEGGERKLGGDLKVLNLRSQKEQRKGSNMGSHKDLRTRIRGVAQKTQRGEEGEEMKWVF